MLTNSETFLKDGDLAASAAPLDHEQMGLSPGYRLYALADGWIALCAREDGQLAAPARRSALRGPMASGPVWPARRCEATLGTSVPSRRALRAGGLDQGEPFLDDPLNRALGLVTSYPHAEWGELEQVGALWSLGDLEVSLELAPPALGRAHRRGPLRGRPRRGRSPSCSPSP